MQREHAEPAVGSISQPCTEAAHTARSLLVRHRATWGGALQIMEVLGPFCCAADGKWDT